MSTGATSCRQCPWITQGRSTRCLSGRGGPGDGVETGPGVKGAQWTGLLVLVREQIEEDREEMTTDMPGEARDVAEKEVNKMEYQQS